jgi:hypothetical protein
MAAVKWLVVILCGVSGLAALGMGVVTGVPEKRAAATASVLQVRLPNFPELLVPSAAVAESPAVAPGPPPVDSAPPAAEEKAMEEKKPVAAQPPEAVAVKAVEAPKPALKTPPAPAAEGLLNLRATDTADVYLDGKKLGSSPLLGVKARVGTHKVRFDCYDAAGNTVTGVAQTVAVKAEAEVELDFTCPTE